MKRYSTAFVLKKALVRIQAQTKGNSVRGLAARLKVSHVFLSRVLAGQAGVPQSRLKSFAKVFQLDPLAEKELKDAMINDLTSSIKIEKLLDISKRKTRKKAIHVFEERPLKHQVVLENWYELPILEYLTCDVLPKDMTSIAESLNIKVSQVAHAIKKLKDSHLIEKDAQDQWKKVTNFIRFPATSPSGVLKNYYTQVLKRAIAELDQTSQDKYDRRLLINFSVATNASKIPELKEKLSQFIYDTSLEMADGSADEVYHLTLGLIPLTKKTSVYADT